MAGFISRGLFGIAACLFLAGCSGDSVLAEKAARERLKQALLAAHEADDPEALLGLYALDGVEDRDLRLIRFAVESEVALPVRSIRFYPLDPGDTIDYVHAGKRYRPTVEPRLKLEVRYDTEDRLTALSLVGFRDGAYQLVAPRPVESAE